MLPMLPRHQRDIEIGVLRSRTPVESIPTGEVSIMRLRLLSTFKYIRLIHFGLKSSHSLRIPGKVDYPSSWRAIGDCVWLSKTLWVKISLKSQMVSFAREESETSTRYGLESYERSYVERIKKYPLSVSPGAQNMSSSTKLFNTWNLKSLKQLLEQSTLFYNSENMMVWF